MWPWAKAKQYAIFAMILANATGLIGGPTIVMPLALNSREHLARILSVASSDDRASFKVRTP